MECVSCTQVFNSSIRVPRLAQCGHSVCEQCLQSTWKNNEYIYYCRACNYKSKTNILQNFPRNLALLSLASQAFDSSLLPSHGFSQVHMTSMDVNSSIGQMNVNYQQKEQNSMNSNNLNQNFPPSLNILHTNSHVNKIEISLCEIDKCKLHGKSFEAYCMDDQEFLCISCILEQQGTHKNHSVETMEGAAEIERKHFREQDEKLEQQEKESEEKLSNFKKYKEDIGQLEITFNQEITNFFIKIITLIKEREQFVKDKLKKQIIQKREFLDERIMDLLKIIEDMTQVKRKRMKINLNDNKSRSKKEFLEKIKEVKEESRQILETYLNYCKQAEHQSNIAMNLLFDKGAEINQIQNLLLIHSTSNLLPSNSPQDINLNQYLNLPASKSHQTPSSQISLKSATISLGKELNNISSSTKSSQTTILCSTNGNSQGNASLINNQEFQIPLSSNSNSFGNVNPNYFNQIESMNSTQLINYNQQKKSSLTQRPLTPPLKSESPAPFSCRGIPINPISLLFGEKQTSSIPNLEKASSSSSGLVRKHSKTLLANQFQQFFQTSASNTSTPNSDVSVHKVEISSLKQARQSSLPKKQQSSCDFKRDSNNINILSLITQQQSQFQQQQQSSQNQSYQFDYPQSQIQMEQPAAANALSYKLREEDKQNLNINPTLQVQTKKENGLEIKTILQLENRSNKNILSTKSQNQNSSKHSNSFKYRPLRGNIGSNTTSYQNSSINTRNSSGNNNNQNCNSQNLSTNLQNTTSQNGNKIPSVEKIKVLRGSALESNKSQRQQTSTSNFQNRPPSIIDPTSGPFRQENAYQIGDLLDSERTVIDTVKIDFSCLLRQKRQLVLALGGFTENLEQTNNKTLPFPSIEKLDLLSAESKWEYFSSTEALTHRVKFGSAVFKQGRSVAVFGGKQEGKRLDSFDEIDMQTKVVQQIQGLRLLKPKCGFGYAQLSDDQIIVVGGNDGKNILADVEVYNISTKQVTSLSPLQLPRDELAIAQSNCGNFVYAFGGYNHNFKCAVNLVERYSIAKNTWEPVKPMNYPRRSHQVVILPDGFYIIGGFDGKNYLSSVEKYDDSNDTWQKIPSMIAPRATFSALKTTDNTGILVLGGFDSQPIANCEKQISINMITIYFLHGRFSIFKGIWENFSLLGTKRFMHGSVLLSNGSNSQLFY